ncbi:von Willebrand factor A domain-containing protein 7-like isoform X1 [Conger conger]|nr:von Willebrand factor A domain-containing protein 7-like isoform X1 [Conger conger]
MSFCSTLMGWTLHVLLLGLLLPGLQAFKPLLGNSITHQKITEMAILRKTTEVCRALAIAEGRDFPIPTGGRLSASIVQRACSPGSLWSTVNFKASIITMYLSNAAVDIIYLLSDRHHFDGEEFTDGRALITDGMASIKANVRQENFISARFTLGKICHTLQDFYSHSNWIELGKKHPNTNLIRPDESIGNIADKDTRTCRSCIGGDCRDNILPEIISEGKITSGYFNIFSSSKPAGKCSHGGSADRTSQRDPTGGINKDNEGADHEHLHRAAAAMAENATMELLEDIRSASGESNFLRLMGITRSSVLCFVIDTTDGMADDIVEAKRVAFSIIDSKKGTEDEPSSYILVPFNDPGFGPLTRTRNSNIFKQRINALSATGGGDEPEMSLSGLLLALSSAPASSEIFVFTDASAKDVHLRSTVIALIESTKSVVNFLLTNALSARRRRDSNGNVSTRMSPLGNQLYQELSEASGGQAIVVTKDTLPQATDIIVDSSTTGLVTVLQVVRNPGRTDNFSFTVDASLRNITTYLTGSSLTFSLISPSGVSQSSSASDGPLGTIKVVGNLHTICLDTQTGLWEIRVTSTQPYTLKVTGRSNIDFVYNIVEDLEGSGSDFTLKEGRLQAGGSGTLLLSVVGGDSLTVTEVSLVEVSGLRVENSTLKPLGEGDYLVSVEKVPDESFVILLKGVDGMLRSPQNSFQRQSNTQLRASTLTLTALANGTMEPGVQFTVPFTVWSNGTAGHYTIRSRDDRGFITSAPSSLPLDSGGSAQGSVQLEAPGSTPSGTDVTLTIEAESPSGGNSNYVVLRLTVLNQVTDFSRPVCQVESVSSNCSMNCSESRWELSANLTDGNGTGIQTVSLRVGDGTLDTTTSLGEGGINITFATYNASCCSPNVELVAVDAVGNVGTCFHSIRDSGITVLNQVTDFSRPVCQVESVSSSCSVNCSESRWELSASLTDGNGTGIQTVSLRLGDGTLDTTTSLGEGGINITIATYNASCCSPNVELVAVDAVGNVGTCFHSIRATPTPAPSSATALRVLLLLMSTALLSAFQA